MKYAFLPLVMLFVLSACQNNGIPQIWQKRGNFDQNIVGGEIVAEDSAVAKATVGIYTKKPRKERPFTQVCTGTLIAENVVLTAAHCVDDQVSSDAKDYRISFGTKVIKSYEDLEQVSIRKGKKIYIHTDWVNKDYSSMREPVFDIALISFEGDLPEGYKPARLPKPDFKPDDNVEMISAGFGLVGTDGDQQQEEADQLLQVENKLTDWHYSTTHFFLRVNGKSTCDGDSGGPAFLKTYGDEPLTVVGITSVGDTWCKYTSYLVRVSTFARWIEKNIPEVE